MTKSHSKKLEDLPEDIYSLFGKAPFQRHSDFYESMGIGIGDVFYERFYNTPSPRNLLRVSNLGTQCDKKLWWDINDPAPESTGNQYDFMFLYGHILEAVVLGMAVEAGHNVYGQQGEVNLYGVPGHFDAIVDGVMVDVKSCSPYGFNKIINEGLTRDNDTFGYLSQLSSYLWGAINNPHYLKRLKETDEAAFICINKVTGDIAVRRYDLTRWLLNKDSEVEYKKELVNLSDNNVIKRAYSAVPDGKSGNLKLDMPCVMCPHKFKCWPGLRVFEYAGGRKTYLTKVKKVPRVKEVTE
jgi:hypothetical protein